MECKLRSINFRGVSDHRRAFRPAFRVIGISDDWYRRTIGVIVISLGTSRSTWVNFGCTGENLGAPATSPGAPMTCLGAPATSLGVTTTGLGALATSLRAPHITEEQSRKNMFFGNAAGASGYHSYYLSFNDFSNSCIQFVFSSIYLYSYPSTHSISRLAAGSAWEQFKVHLEITIQWTQRYTPRP